jgi:hypothetical protein
MSKSYFIFILIQILRHVWLCYMSVHYVFGPIASATYVHGHDLCRENIHYGQTGQKGQNIIFQIPYLHRINTHLKPSASTLWPLRQHFTDYYAGQPTPQIEMSLILSMKLTRSFRSVYVYILWHADPLLSNDRKIRNYTQPLLSNESTNNGRC